MSSFPMISDDNDYYKKKKLHFPTAATKTVCGTAERLSYWSRCINLILGTNGHSNCRPAADSRRHITSEKIA